MAHTTIRPRLTASQEAELARRIEAGVLAAHLLASGERPLPASRAELRTVARQGEHAFEEFLLGYLRLVGRLATDEARRSGMATDDLFQEGFVAMAQALQRFDYRLGRFSTYATVRVRQHLIEAGASRLGEMGLPPSRAVRVRRARGLAAALGQQLQRTANAAEVADAMGASTHWARSLLGYLAPVNVDTVAELLADPVPVDPDERLWAQQVRGLVAQLPEAQAQVVALRYGLATGEPVGVSHAAARLGVSISTVQRLERAGLAHLRRLAGPVYEQAG